jgi:hypothetical protein
MDSIRHVSAEMIKFIPEFTGSPRKLGTFIKKCEYILTNYGEDNNIPQMTYLFHLITSRLGGEAADLVGSREHIESWEELKELLTLHFGDRRTEDCLAKELESLRLNRGESYEELFKRIQQTRNDLMAKVSETNANTHMRLSKRAIYDHTAFKVFLSNLPMYLNRWVRMRNVATLEQALEIVLEDQNYQSSTDFISTPVINRNPRLGPVNSYNNSSAPRQNTSQRQPQAQGPSSSNYNQIPFMPNNSGQYRNPRPFNNFNQSGNYRGPQFGNPHMHRQQQADNAPRTWQNNAPVASGSNTDVTMRTASSRRINYTDNNYITDSQQGEPGPYSGETGEETLENFFLRASSLGNR